MFGATSARGTAGKVARSTAKIVGAGPVYSTILPFGSRVKYPRSESTRSDIAPEVRQLPLDSVQCSGCIANST